MAASTRLPTATTAAPPRRPAALAPQRPLVHGFSRVLLRPLFRAYFRMRQDGFERLPPGPCLIAPNHVSMLDWAFLLYWFSRPTRFVVHREYYDRPLMRVGLRVNGAVAVRTDRPDLAAMRAARAVLAAGERLVLFPEGGISRSGRPARAQPGIISLAVAAQVPIVPVAIRGAFEAFPRSARLPRPGRVSVVFGTPLPPPTAADRSAQRRLADRLMVHITALLDGAPQPSPPWDVSGIA